MNIKSAATLGLSMVALASLAACAPVDRGFGTSFRSNIAVQTVEPDVRYDQPMVSNDGVKAAGAIERYRTDDIKKPKGIKTTTGQIGSSAGSGATN